MRWPSFLATRLREYCLRNGFDNEVLVALEAVDWQAWSESMKLLSPFARSHVLRTLLNAWTTSFRVPVADRQYRCLYCGKDGLERLAHMLQCSPLWSMICQACKLSSTPSVLSRMGVSTDKHILSVVAFSSYLYHTIKHSPMHATRIPYVLKAYNILARTNISGPTSIDHNMCRYRLRFG